MATCGRSRVPGGDDGSRLSFWGELRHLRNDPLNFHRSNRSGSQWNLICTPSFGTLIHRCISLGTDTSFCKEFHMAQLLKSSLLTLVTLLLCTAMVVAQGTKITPPKNNYKPSDDVQVGREAAAQVSKELPLLPENGDVDSY